MMGRGTTEGSASAGTPAVSSLSGLERRLMDMVWDCGRATADEIRLALEPERSLKDSTVRTVLRRLEAKGFLTHDTEGRTYVYRPLVRPTRAAAAAVRQLIDRFCGGSVEELLVGLVDDEVVEAEQLEELAKRIAASERGKGDEHV